MKTALFTFSLLFTASLQISAQVNLDSSFFNQSDSAAVQKYIDPKEIIENYIAALGGKENIALVEDRTIEMSGSVMGFDIKMVTYQKYPNFLRQEIEAGEASQTILYDGEKGFIRLGETTREISGNELEKLKFETIIRLLLNIDSLGIALKYAGTDSSNEIITNKIEMILPSGQKWVQYYDTLTGLKVKEEKEVETPQGIFMQETLYKDFREVNGLKYPYEIIQNLGMQDMVFKVDTIKVNSGLSEEKFLIDP